jgi:hypothetical protein
VFASNLIKIFLFRFVASVLLVLSLGFVMCSESNVCAMDETFVKSHSPVSDNYVLALSVDDKEDMDEDNAIDLPVSAGMIGEAVSIYLVSKSFYTSLNERPDNAMGQVYLRHRQLLI